MMEAQDREAADVKDQRPLSTADLAGRPEEGGRQAGAGGVRDLRHKPEEEERGDGQGEESAGPGAEPLFPQDRTEAFQVRWDEIQTRFVDQPRESVQAADTLVAELMQQLADGFSQARSRLEGQWDRGDEVSTEDLRVALQRYRSFFQRLLAA